MVKQYRGPRRLAATTAVVALAATSLTVGVSFPAGAAETCTETHLAVTGGSFEWGVKESWRNYVTGPVAKGRWNLTGVRDTGSAFAFTPVSGNGGLSEDGTGVIPFSGSVNFTGHGGALDMTLSDIALEVDGAAASIRVDYETYTTDFQTSGQKGDKRTGNDVIIATVDLGAPVKAGATSFSLAGATTLTSAGADLFQAYDTGARMDPAGGTVSLKETCGAAPGGSGSGTGGGGRATTGMGGLLAGLNDTFSEVNTLLGNTTELFDNSEDLYDRTWADNGGRGTTASPGATGNSPGAGATTDTGATGTTPTSGGNPGTTTSGTGTAGTSGTGASPGVASTGTPAGNTAGANNTETASTSGDVCTADGSLGVTQAEAQWGVRSSFRNYISGGIANGGWELSGVGYDNGTFTFTGDSGAVDPQQRSGTVLFPGALRFTGHGGVLDTRFSNMEIQFAGDSGSLLVNASSNSTEGEPNDYGRVVLATLNFSELQVSESEAAGTAVPHLTEAGARAFGDFYPAGDTLDPITFRAALGGGASCAAGQGGSATSSATGGSDGAGAAAELRAAGTSGTVGEDGAAGGSVFDEITGEGTTTTSDSLNAAADGSQFRVRSAGEDNPVGNDRLITLVLLIVAAFVVAGASLSSFARRNPTVGSQGE